MNDIPPFHVCNALTKENEVITAKYRKLTRKYKELEKQMTELKEKLMRSDIKKEIQPPPSEFSNTCKQPRTILKSTKPQKDISTDKLLTLHNKLQKQYEKEAKQNATQGKKMRNLQAENEKLKDDLFSSNQQIEEMKKRLQDKENQLHFLSTKVKATSTPKNVSSTVEIMAINKEKNRLLLENQKLRGELNGLDKSFFEEIEDMKYALQQSAKLNAEYEKALKKLCKQFGVNLETVFGTKKEGSGKKKRRKSSNFKS